MTADMVIRFFENYGWIMTVLATSGIVFVGCLKALGLFSRLKPKAKKYVYFGCSCVVSIIVCTIYLCVNNMFAWVDWGMTAACIIGYTMAIYGIYENTGVRALLKKVLFIPAKNLLKNLTALMFSKNISKEKLQLLAKDLGSDILMQLAEEIQHEQVTLVKNVMVIDNASEKTQNNISEIDVEKNTANSDGHVKNHFFS